MICIQMMIVIMKKKINKKTPVIACKTCKGLGLILGKRRPDGRRFLQECPDCEDKWPTI